MTPGSLPGYSGVDISAERYGDHPHDRPGIFYQRQVNGEFTGAPDKLLGPVQGVNHPQLLPLPPCLNFLVTGLLGQHW